MKKNKTTGIRMIMMAMIVFSLDMIATTAVLIGNLQVEYTKNPIGIDVEKPRFSWQMNGDIGRMLTRSW